MKIHRKKTERGIIIDPSKYYYKPSYTDITLITDENPDGIPCNRLILSLYSGYFKRLFETQWVEREQYFHIMPCYWFKKFIDFIYNGKLSFKFNEFEKVVEFGSFLKIKGITEYCDQDQHILSLIEVYGYSEMLEISKAYKLDKCYAHTISRILESRDINILLSLSFNMFKQMLSLTTIPIDYDARIKEKCKDRKVNITIKDGKCFGNVPIIYSINDSAMLYRVKQVIHFTTNLDIFESASPYENLMVSTIIRNGITTVTINNTEHDSLIDKSIRDMKLTYSTYRPKYEIFSPDEDTCVIIVRDCETNEFNAARIYRSDSPYNDITSQISRINHDDKVIYKDINKVCVAVSPTHIYAGILHYIFDNDGSARAISYAVIDVHDGRTTHKSVRLQNDIALNCSNTIHSISYLNNLLYIIVGFTNRYEEYGPTDSDYGILVVDLNVDKIIYNISPEREMRHSLFSFGNIMYCGIIRPRRKDYKIRKVTLYEIQNNEFVKLTTIFDTKDLHTSIVATGSYITNKVTHAIK